jgi:hypothetical protein
MTSPPRSQPMTATADLIRELRDDFPAVDVTTVVFSRDFAGMGCCIIPQEKVLEIIARIQALEGTLQIAQELFAIMVSPQDHPNTSVLHLWAQCKEIECKIRALLQPKDGSK